ncbi:unnamed protein product [Ilex paraguariensis]|uniref:Uncharacterized protein n=1 Tax=Ilex paraguariensis TaxID=185542 RepID=A0ABC8RJK1_9AQUA
MRSNICLEWDDKKKSVIAKREQISISRRELFPFIDAVPHCSNILADVFTVPHEIFELENLTEVHLSENERNLLTSFLPKEAEPHKVVQELLAGDNFHFGIDSSDGVPCFVLVIFILIMFFVEKRITRLRRRHTVQSYKSIIMI